jgi:hypothetical protein
MMPGGRYYILNDDGEPVATNDVMVWARFFERRDRILKQDFVEGARGGVGVSTVFLGLDHNWSGVGPPVLWETLVFGTPLDGEMRRYTSKADALRGHAEMLAEVRAAWSAHSQKE